MTLDEVLAAAPVAPPCFKSRRDWADYLLECQQQGGEHRRGKPFDDGKYRQGFNYCKDCTKPFQEQMAQAGRCMPAGRDTVAVVRRYLGDQVVKPAFPDVPKAINGYSPPPGSMPARVLKLFRGLPEGTELYTWEICTLLGGKNNVGGFGAYLAPAVAAGALRRRHESARRVKWMLMEERAAAADGPQPVPPSRRPNVRDGASVFEYGSESGRPPFSLSKQDGGLLRIERRGRVVDELTPVEQGAVLLKVLSK